MIPALVAVAQDVKALCPQALFINYSNPMTANCTAIRQATGLPVVGLCHGVFHVERQLAEFMGAPPAEVSSLYAGLNHLTFLYDLRWRGRDGWPLVRARLAAERGEPAALAEVAANYPALQPASEEFKAADNPFSWSIFERYGAYPAVNDRHVVEFFPERFPQGSYYGKVLGVDAYSHERTIARGDQRYAEMRAQALGERPLDERIFARVEGEHEQLTDMIRSLAQDSRRLFNVNLPNQGAVPNLPADAILELPAAATATGLRPLQLVDFPAMLAAIIIRKLSAVTLTVAAALTGSRALVVEALLADGSLNDAERARQLADELIQAHKQHLPQFA
jgi:alpha-galactosidase